MLLGKRLQRQRRRRRLRGVCASVCLLLTAACSVQASGAEQAPRSASPQAADNPKLSGDPVVIGSMFPVSAPLSTFPQLPYIAQVAVKAVNAAGGINGRPLKWVHCDDKGDPNVAAKCADELLNQTKVRALVESVGVQGNIAWPFIKKADVINWFNVPIWPDDTTSPLSYPAGLGIFAHQNIGLLVKQHEFKKVACLTAEGAVSTKLCNFAKESLAAKGITDFKKVSWPSDTTTFLPYAAKVLADDYDAVVMGVGDAITAPVLQALADMGVDVPVLAASTSIGSQSIKAARETGMTLRVATSWATDPTENAARAQMLEAIQKYGPSVGAPPHLDTVSDNAFNMYEGILSLADVMNGAKSLKTADLQTYIAEHPVLTGATPPLDWTKPGPVPGSPRVVQVYAESSRLSKDGVLTAPSDLWGSVFPGVDDIKCCAASTTAKGR
ncbi:ABC transporter substrate-binding protein [Streptomyces sp. NPDC096311]|uniref:ABC transporter substrate-binding protein n=1 Tax=Streptomyces sp. NPDC096311 TaxID=3366083 RepID=UPI00381A8359